MKCVYYILQSFLCSSTDLFFFFVIFTLGAAFGNIIFIDNSKVQEGRLQKDMSQLMINPHRRAL